MPPHPDDLTLLRWADGEIDPHDPSVDHVVACPACQERMALLTSEGHCLRGALALTYGDLQHLRQADLPRCLITVVMAEARTACIAAGLRQLAVLLVLTLGIAASWAMVTPWLEALWSDWTSVFDAPTVTLLLLGQAATAAIGGALALVEQPTGLVLVEVVLLVSLLASMAAWQRWPRATASLPA